MGQWSVFTVDTTASTLIHPLRDCFLVLGKVKVPSYDSNIGHEKKCQSRNVNSLYIVQTSNEKMYILYQLYIRLHALKSCK